ncbi:hypothetical protein Hamer_G000995 [Homarus americanus]|uniref:Uncharacterized protein n=1 Tax=Homarus americanus TaxID=6706 RepID=A0A8J5T2R7_HOMAM|nr:hypothetical protein Hamer_G000995 [Homarus americanus]
MTEYKLVVVGVDFRTLLKLHLALVRPYLDYTVQFWSPIPRKNSEENLEYRDRLKHLNLHSPRDVYKWKSGLNKGGITKWNKFPNIIINSNLLDSFKHRSDGYMSNSGWV